MCPSLACPEYPITYNQKVHVLCIIFKASLVTVQAPGAHKVEREKAQGLDLASSQ